MQCANGCGKAVHPERLKVRPNAITCSAKCSAQWQEKRRALRKQERRKTE